MLMLNLENQDIILDGLLVLDEEINLVDQAGFAFIEEGIFNPVESSVEFSNRSQFLANLLHMILDGFVNAKPEENPKSRSYAADDEDIVVKELRKVGCINVHLVNTKV